MKKTSCFCCVNLAGMGFFSDEVAYARVISTNITKAAYGPLPPQITSSASETTQSERARPPPL